MIVDDKTKVYYKRGDEVLVAFMRNKFLTVQKDAPLCISLDCPKKTWGSDYIHPRSIFFDVECTQSLYEHLFGCTFEQDEWRWELYKYGKYRKRYKNVIISY